MDEDKKPTQAGYGGNLNLTARESALKDKKQQSLTDIIDEASSSLNNLVINFSELHTKLEPILDRHLGEDGKDESPATVEPSRPDEKMRELVRSIKILNKSVKSVLNRMNL